MGASLSILGGDSRPDEQKVYCVEGYARLVNGTTIPDQVIQAYDVDLRSRQLLGRCRTDCDGHYAITYTASQFRRAEKGSADLQIVAVEDSGSDEVGSSSISYNAPSQISIDVVIGGTEVRGLSEFESLLQAITPVLDGVRVDELVEDGKTQNVSFLVGETGMDRNKLQLLIIAHQSNKTTSVDARFFYATSRRDLPTDVTALFQIQRSELLLALESATKDNIVALSEKDMTAMVDHFIQTATSTVSGENKSSPSPAKAGEILKSAVPHLEPVISAFSAAKSTADFWDRLSSDPGTKDNVKEIQTRIQFGTVTLNNQKLVNHLLEKTPEIEDFKGLTKYRESDWVNLIQKANAEVPNEITGSDAADRTRVYATSMARLVEEALPTDFLRNRLTDADDTATLDGKSGKSDLVTFLTNNAAFNIKGGRLTRMDQKTHDFSNVQDQGTLVSNISKLQRLYAVAPRYDQVRPLLAHGIDSAMQITRLGRTNFTTEYAQSMGSPKEAELVYDRAHYTQSYAFTLFTQYGTRGPPYNIPVLIENSGILAADPPTGIPDWAELFGPTNSCSCDECQALDSPAAYYVDILHFLKDRVDGVTLSDKVANAKDVLFLRRPDLGEIELTCSNTKTPLPYIDLTNEILEDAVKAPANFTSFKLDSTVIPFLDNHKVQDLKTAFKPDLVLVEPKIIVIKKGEEWRVDEPNFTYSLTVFTSAAGPTGVQVASRSRQTTGNVQDLAATPQYTNSDAYRVLADVVYPLSLPFNLPLMTVRSYLQHLGIQRSSLMEAFSFDTYPKMLENEDSASEYLGLSPEQAKIISGTTNSQVGSAEPGEWNLWGFSKEILDTMSAISDPAQKLSRIDGGSWVEVLTGRVDVFLQQSSLKYLDLLNLLGICPLIDINGEPAIQPLTGCLLDQLHIDGLTSADLHRIICFVRLWKGLVTWSMTDLARAYQQYASHAEVATFSTDLLLYVAQLQRLSTTLSLPMNAVLSFFGDLDTEIRVDHTLSDDTSTPVSQFDEVFNSSTVIGPGEFKFAEGVSLGSLEDHVPGLTAALSISSGELSLLLSDARVLQTHDVSVTNLTILYRHTILAKALNMPISDYLLLVNFMNWGPFSTPVQTLDFVRRSNSALASGFSLTELAYLLAHDFTPGSSVRLDDVMIGGITDSLRTGLTQIATDDTLQAEKMDQNGDLLKAKLATLSWEPDVVTELVAIVTNSASFTTTLQTTTAIETIFPTNQSSTYPVSRDLQSRFSFDIAAQKLTIRGALTLDDKNVLTSPEAQLPQQVINQILVLFNAPRIFLFRNASSFKIQMYDAPLDALPTGLSIPISLRQKVFFDVQNRVLKSSGALSESQRDALLQASADNSASNPYIVAVNALFSAPDTANPSPVAPFLTKADVGHLLDAATDQGEENTPYRRYTYVLERVLPYVLNTQSDQAVTNVIVRNLGLDSQSANYLLDQKKTSMVNPLRATFRDTNFSQTSLKIPSTRTLFPAQFETYELLLKMAMIISRLRLTTTQLNWIFNFRTLPGDSSSGWLNLFDLPLQLVADPRNAFVGWERLIALTDLRDNTPGGESTLDLVFTKARAPSPNLEILLQPIIDQTKLSTVDINYLAGAQGFNMQVPDGFKDEIALTRLFKCLRLIQTIGCSAADAQSLSKPSLDFTSSQTAIQAVKSRYDEDTWNAVAPPLRNILRESQRQALIDYLTSRNLSQGQLFHDANDLFSYYLIDVEMGPCQLTSRLKQAICSVQLFVQRCFLRLEPSITTDVDADPTWNEWSWMKYENVHAANYQILMNPENYLEPELRDEQTDFFQQLRNDLQQTDINDDTATAAFSTYLDKLDEISRLEVVSFFHEQE